MTVNALIEKTGYKPLLLSDGDREITGGYAGDLLSWVMGRAESGDCWVTIMSNVNVAAVGQLTDCACIVFSEDVCPDENTVNAAKKSTNWREMSDMDARLSTARPNRTGIIRLYYSLCHGARTLTP